MTGSLGRLLGNYLALTYSESPHNVRGRRNQGAVNGTQHQTRPTSNQQPFRMDLLQGTLDVLILKTLSWEPMHGYAISRWIRRRTDDVLTVEDAALYQALHRLERKGLIESEWGLSENNRRAKYYQLTAAGRKQFRAEATEWRQYAEAVFKVLETASQ
jgi:PadR family transcriptional regulator, regulatory protein PadR